MDTLAPLPRTANCDSNLNKRQSQDTGNFQQAHTNIFTKGGLVSVCVLSSCREGSVQICVHVGL